METWPLCFFADKTSSFMKGGRIMTYKQIEASREVRLWIGQVIIPAIGVVAVLMSNPQTKFMIINKTNKIKRSIKNKFTKEWEA